jgi:hypothetical protein
MTQTATAPALPAAPNVPGQIYAADYILKVNNNYGTIVYKQPAPRVKLREAVPQPPRSPRGFVGRDKELVELEKLIAAGEAIVVYGAEGIGKTALVRRAANGDAARGLPGGVVLVEGVDATGTGLGPDDVIQCLFDALCESDPPLKVTALTARTYLSNTRPLVLLDNVNLPPAALTSVCDLFPKGALLASMPISPSGDAAERIKLGPLTRLEAVELFASRADITLNDAVRETIGGICALLGDIPLALVTAANVIRENNIALGEARTTLELGSPVPAGSVEEAVRRVYALAASVMSREELQALAFAASVPGLSVDPDWLHRMLEDSPTAVESVERLKGMGLLHANSPRLRVDAAMRSAGELGGYLMVVRETLPQYLLDKIQARPLDFDDRAAELGNILFAIDIAGDAQALALARAISPFLTLSGQWDVWKKVLDRALQAARRTGDQNAEAWALHELGTRAMGAGARDSAIAFLQQALELRRALGDRAGEAYTRHNLSFLAPPGPPPDRRNPGSRPGPSGRPSLLVVGGVVGGLVAVALATLIVAGSIIAGQRTPTPTATRPPTLTPSVVPDTTGPEILKPSARPDPSFYGPHVAGCGPSRVELSMVVQDESGVDGVTIAYHYESGRRVGKIQQVAAKAAGGGRYRAAIDNNLDGQAFSDLKDSHGLIRWSVSAVDTHGNTARVEDLTAQVNYCSDTTGPQVADSSAKPDPTHYGECGNLELTFTVAATDLSGISGVQVGFRYEGRGATDWITVTAQPAGSGIFQVTINNNTYKPSSRLGAAGGVVRWYALVTDTTGNTTQTPDQTVPIFYCIG